MNAILLLLAVGCGPSTYDVALRLPDAGTLVAQRTARAITRTPVGPENLEVKTTKRYEVLEGGRVGVDRLHWREEFVRYEIVSETRAGTTEWKLERDEEGALVAIPANLASLAPDPPREVWVHPDRRIEIRWLPWPEPEPQAEADGVPDVAEATEATPTPPEPPPIEAAGLDQLDNFIAGLVLAPSRAVKPDTSWSWTVSQQVTHGGQVANTSAWTFTRMAGSEAVLVENLTLNKATAPARDEFRTTALTGAGEMRFDVRTGLPVTYSSAFEATLASPSARGTSSMKVETKFRWRDP